MYRNIARQVYGVSILQRSNATCDLPLRTFALTPNRNSADPMPRLMNFPEIIWPSFYNTVRNWVLVNFVVRPYFDRDFSIKEFLEGAKQAIQVVSKKLANVENMDNIKDLIKEDALEELKNNTKNLSVAQRQQLGINKNDIFLIFPYEVGIILGEDEVKPQKRFLEITTVCHVLHGFNEMQERGEKISWNFGNMSEYQDQLYVCNYRFIKEYTKEVESSWIINMVNHFKPSDLIKESQQPTNEK